MIKDIDYAITLKEGHTHKTDDIFET